MSSRRNTGSAVAWASSVAVTSGRNRAPSGGSGAWRSRSLTWTEASGTGSPTDGIAVAKEDSDRVHGQKQGEQDDAGRGRRVGPGCLWARGPVEDEEGQGREAVVDARGDGVDRDRGAENEQGRRLADRPRQGEDG